MSSPEDRDKEPFDWLSRRWRVGFSDIFRGFDDMRREMQKEFEDAFKNIQDTAPKDLVKEYQTPAGDKVREYGPFIYGYSMTVGPDGKPKVKEFGNVKSPFSIGTRADWFTRPLISSEREPLADITTTDKEVKVAVEMPGVRKENIKINVYDNSLEVTTAGTEDRKYHEVIKIPPETDIETATSSYKNGILEVVFKKKEPKGKQINIE
jgi:HSP20 family protein